MVELTLNSGFGFFRIDKYRFIDKDANRFVDNHKKWR